MRLQIIRMMSRIGIAFVESEYILSRKEIHDSFLREHE
jgi:hypothetical protein